MWGELEKSGKWKIFENLQVYCVIWKFITILAFLLDNVRKYPENENHVIERRGIKSRERRR